MSGYCIRRDRWTNRSLSEVKSSMSLVRSSASATSRTLSRSLPAGIENTGGSASGFARRHTSAGAIRLSLGLLRRTSVEKSTDPESSGVPVARPSLCQKPKPARGRLTCRSAASAVRDLPFFRFSRPGAACRYIRSAISGPHSGPPVRARSQKPEMACRGALPDG